MLQCVRHILCVRSNCIEVKGLTSINHSRLYFKMTGTFAAVNTLYAYWHQPLVVFESALKTTYFLAPPDHHPLKNPAMPPACGFCSTLSSSDGNWTRFSAKSKNSGLAGIGSKSGGNFVRLGLFVSRVWSSKYSYSLSSNGYKRISTQLLLKPYNFQKT